MEALDAILSPVTSGLNSTILMTSLWSSHPILFQLGEAQNKRIRCIFCPHAHVAMAIVWGRTLPGSQAARQHAALRTQRPPQEVTPATSTVVHAAEVLSSQIQILKSEVRIHPQSSSILLRPIASKEQGWKQRALIFMARQLNLQKVQLWTVYAHPVYALRGALSGVGWSEQDWIFCYRGMHELGLVKSGERPEQAGSRTHNCQVHRKTH